MEPVIFSENKERAEEAAQAKPGPEPSGPQSRLAGEIWDLLKTVIVAFAIMLLLNIFVFNLSIVKGQSMEPTLEERERLFIDRLVYRFGHPQRGEVVILKDPSAEGERKPFLVKRVVAVPGDTVEVRDHMLCVNGEEQDEPYTDAMIEDGDVPPVKLGEGEYFVMGDNRHAGSSKDSRYFGSVKEDQIVGRAEFVFWPIGKIRGL
ncbi:signal peptidase I [Paenibacillus oralis]|uniref:Signal peptidase I n=1 Tax=Paenibacillus oralis TaxID=2490856 RepID=A0A3P3U122_9BACL|nr:signal peptidase I [Paenibacillus oralis]RRJ63810.1 signal peptidase I [Paenibacillus oralis]